MRDRRWLAGPTALLAGLLVLAYALSRGPSFGVELDESISRDLEYTGGRPLDDASSALLGSVDVFVALTLLVVVLAALRRRYAPAALAAGLLLVAAAGTEALKRVLESIDPFGIEASREGGTSAFPSGHTALAYAAAVGLVFLAPPRYRLPVAVGAAGYAAAVGIASVTDGGHYPSDVLGSLLLVLAGAAAALALLGRRAVPQATGSSRRATVAAGVAVALLLAYLLDLVGGREGVRSYTAGHGDAIGALAVIVAVGVGGALALTKLADACARLVPPQAELGPATPASRDAGT